MRENYPPRPQKGMGGHMFGRETVRQRRVKTHLVVTTSALSDVLPDLRHASPGALPARCSSGWPPLLASIDVNKSAVSPGRPLSAELFGPHLEQGPLRGAMRMLSREGFMYFWDSSEGRPAQTPCSSAGRQADLCCWLRGEESPSPRKGRLPLTALRHGHGAFRP